MMKKTMSRILKCAIPVFLLLIIYTVPVVAEEKTARELSFERAKEQFWENQHQQQPFSIKDDFTWDGLDLAFKWIEEQAEKMNEPGRYDDIIPGAKIASKAYNAWSTIKDGLDAYHYESPHKHAVFRWADEKAQWFKAVVDLFNFGESDPSIPGLILYAEDKAIDAGYSFIDTPEVVETLNNADNLPTKILDPPIVVISEAEEFAWYCIRHFFTFDKDKQDQLAKDYIDSFDFQERWEDALHYKVPNGVNAYKPNIYLYGPAGMETTVTFDRPELLTKVIPDYSGSWRTVIGADGSLYVNGMADEEPGFSYLFYESDCDEFLMQTEKGWLIPAEEREATFRTVLQTYSFNERETEDFVRYWVEKLEPGVDYMMFPQDTDTVDLAMPVSLSGDIPEEIRRIWFYFLPADAAGDAVETPAEIMPIQRGASTMVEWGGVLR